MDIPIIYQDDHILVLDKPAGLVVTPTETQHETTLSEILQKDFGINLDRGGIVHRLDKDTSGLIVVAKTEKSLINLQSQFKQRSTKKEYTALVHGRFINPQTVDAPIGRNPGDREKFTIVTEGKEAVTEFKPVRNFQFTIFNLQKFFVGFNKIQMRKIEKLYGQGFTLIQCSPKTGRTHQIRVHLKYINFPLVSDEKYGGRKIVRLDKRWCPRQFLHASKLEIVHPESGEKMSFSSEIPEDLEMALSNLESRV
jgi:23S rRNA pseudouridine1911/1915/1917 synthase